MKLRGRNSADGNVAMPLAEHDGAAAHVVYFVASSLSQREIERFGMAELRRRGCRVTVIDVADICHPTIVQNRDHYGSFGDLRPRVVHDVAALEDVGGALRDASLIFCLVTTGMVTRPVLPILREITRSGRPYGLICSNTVPGVRNYKGELRSLHKRIKDIYARRKMIDPVSSLLARLPIRLLGLRAADFAVYGGAESRRPQQLIGRATRAILAHAYDYEAFLSDKHLPQVTTDTAVFLDQYIPHHRDWALLGVPTVVDVETYYPGLRLLFDRIERELGLEVVIAAHPRADYSDKPGVFGNRRIIFGESHRLTRECRLALTFTSLAINYAVLARKPAMLLTTERYYRSPAGHRYTDPMAAELGLPVIFLEHAAEADLSRSRRVDAALYDRYIATYVKMPGSPERPYWDIVLDGLRAYLPAASFRAATAA